MYRLVRHSLVAAAVPAPLRSVVTRSISKTIFIKNLPHGVTPDDLYTIYVQFGNVKMLRVYNEFKVTYAMVIYNTMQSAIAAVDETNDTILFDKGRRVAVDFSKFNSDGRGGRLHFKHERNKGNKPNISSSSSSNNSSNSEDRGAGEDNKTEQAISAADNR